MNAQLRAAIEAHAAAVQPLFDAIVEINRRNHFAPADRRTAEDNERWSVLWAHVRALDEAFDAAHPVPPCPRCGMKRTALANDGGCLNVGACPLAPSVIGG